MSDYLRVASLSASQWGEGGSNAGFDCVPTSFCLVVEVLGGPLLSVSDIVRAAYGENFHGPTGFDVIEVEVRKRYPALPSITYGQPDDVLAAADVAGTSSSPVLCTFHSTAGGTIVTGETGFIHVCPILAHDRGLVVVLNVEHNTEVPMTEAAFAGATSGTGAGVLAVFNRAIPAPAA